MKYRWDLSINFHFESFYRVYERNWLNLKFCGGGPQVEPKPTSSGKNLLILWNTTLSVAAQLMGRHCITEEYLIATTRKTKIKNKWFK